MLTVQPTKYIYPPRAEKAIPKGECELLKEMGWIAQLKYNDSRCLIKYLPNNSIELWNRHGERFRNYTAPDWLVDQLRIVQSELGLEPNNYHLLDGGLLDQKHKLINDTIVIWDILVRNGTHLLGTTYRERYESLIQNANIPWYCKEYKLGKTWNQEISHVFSPEIWSHEHWSDLWGLIEQINRPYTIGTPDSSGYKISPVLEGLLFKDMNGSLEMGYRVKNNDHWQLKSRVHTGRHRF